MRVLVRVALVGLILALVGGTVPVGAADPPGRQVEGDGAAPAADGFDRLAECIGANGRLLVVLLIDESGSLKETDPNDQRVAAARAALVSLDRLRGSGTGGETQIDVLVSAFSADFRPVGDWTVLDSKTRGEVDAAIAGLADRDSGLDTDFYTALDGAREAMARRSAEIAETGGGEVCKAVLFFTDGDFVIGARKTEAEREELGTTKPYAPDIPLVDDSAAAEVGEAGKTALCEPGGVVDDLRADGITLITVPLTQNLDPESRQLIEAITTGEKDGFACGDPDTDDPGVYLPAADADELLRTFDLVASRIAGGVLADDPTRVPLCPGEPCDEGTVEFSVAPSLRRVHLFATVPGGKGRVLIQPPEGDPLELRAGEDQSQEVDGVPVQATWIAEGALTVDLDIPPDGSGAGTWKAVVISDGEVGDARSVVQVINFSDIVAALTPESSLALGEETTLTATLTARQGDDVDPDVDDVTVTGVITDPITGEEQPIELAPDDEGFSTTYAVPLDSTAAALRVSLRLEATTSEGARISSVSPAEDLLVRRPEGYPQVATPSLDLSSITGEGTAEGTLTLVAPDDAESCAWLEDFEVLDAPADAGSFSVTADGLERSKAECTPLKGTVEVPVEVTPSDRAAGTARGYLRVVVAKGTGEAPIPTDVPVAFEMARGVDEAKRIVVAVGLMLGGLLLPLALLVVINLLTTRFQVLRHVRAAKVPVVVGPTGRVDRTDGLRRGLSLVDSDFHALSGEGGHRRFTWGGLVFIARAPLNPFGEPHAVVAPEEGTADVSREGRRTDLSLGLSGSWLFLLDPDATRAALGHGAAAGEVHGQLVAFVATGSLPAQTSRLGTDISDRLPATARRLARLADVVPEVTPTT